jgi:hypothetical protein
MAFAEDLSVFLDDDDFAVHASVFAVDGDSGNLIFDANGLVLADMGVQTSSPSAVGAAADWAHTSEGQVLEIEHASGTVGYLVRGVTPLDDGAFVLITLARNA